MAFSRPAIVEKSEAKRKIACDNETVLLFIVYAFFFNDGNVKETGIVCELLLATVHT